MDKPFYKYITFYFLILLLFFVFLIIFFGGFKLYDRIKTSQKRIYDLEQKFTAYQYDKKLNRLEFENIYLVELSKIRINRHNYNFKKLQLDQELMFPAGYIDIFKDNLIFLSGDGKLFHDKLSNVHNYKNEDTLNLSQFDSNLIDLSGVSLLSEFGGSGIFTSMFVRDTLISGNNIFIVCNTYKKIDNKIFVSPAILKSKIDFETNTLQFDIFFKTDQELLYFTLNDNNEIDFIDDKIDFRHSGGRIEKYEGNKYVYAVPDYNQLSKVEKKDSIYGKILLIDSENNYQILTFGHRNQQGLLYDKEKKIILSTEHGPSGGDEINLIKKGKGYGWPFISKGIDPQVISEDHEGNNYEEPLYYWTTNPGISQIIKIPEDIKKNRAFKAGSYLVASLRGSEAWSGRSLWNFKIHENNDLYDLTQIYVGDRIRDLAYDKVNEKIILVLENQISLGIIDTKKQNLLHNSF